MDQRPEVDTTQQRFCSWAFITKVATRSDHSTMSGIRRPSPVRTAFGAEMSDEETAAELRLFTAACNVTHLVTTNVTSNGAKANLNRAVSEIMMEKVGMGSLASCLCLSAGSLIRDDLESSGRKHKGYNTCRLRVRPAFSDGRRIDSREHHGRYNRYLHRETPRGLENCGQKNVREHYVRGIWVLAIPTSSRLRKPLRLDGSGTF
jgi:hypothetical protein